MLDSLELLGVILCCVGAALLIGAAMLGLGCEMVKW